MFGDPFETELHVRLGTGLKGSCSGVRTGSKTNAVTLQKHLDYKCMVHAFWKNGTTSPSAAGAVAEQQSPEQTGWCRERSLCALRHLLPAAPVGPTNTHEAADTTRPPFFRG